MLSEDFSKEIPVGKSFRFSSEFLVLANKFNSPKKNISKCIDSITNKYNININALEQLLLNDTSIIIDDFLFIIHEKIQYRYDRQVVNISSINLYTGKKTNFLVYNSISEMGFWRLLLVSVKKDLLNDIRSLALNRQLYQSEVFIKGLDYVSSNFISVPLQVYLNDVINKIPQKSVYGMTVEVLKSFLFPGGDSRMWAYTGLPQISNGELNGDKFNFVYSKERIFHNKYFDLLNKICKTGLCFSQEQFTSAVRKIQSLDDNIEEEKYLKNLFNTTVKCDVSKSHRWSIEKEDIECIHECYSQFMEHYFELYENNEATYIGSYSHNINPENEARTYKMYSINIRCKEYPYDKFTVFFSNYKRKGNFYNFIVNVIPYGAKTNEYGLYDKIVAAGVYIGKPYDYVSQCVIGSPCEKYNFIGNYIASMWPLNVMELPKTKVPEGEKTDCIENAKKLYDVYDRKFAFPLWVINFLEDSDVQSYFTKTKVYYAAKHNKTEIEKLCLEREPVNIDMERFYDQQLLQQAFGWKLSRYQTYWDTNGQLAPNFGIYCVTPVKRTEKDPSYKKVHVYNAIGAALDNEKQPDYQFFIKNRETTWIVYKLRAFYDNVFTSIFECMKDNKLEYLVMSGVGANNFARLYPGGLSAFQRQIWAPIFFEVYETYKYLFGDQSVAKKVFFMGFDKSPAQTLLRTQYGLDIKDIGFFPNLLKSISPSSLDKTLIVNAWDPHSIVGNGNSNDNSLDGFVGRVTACSVLCWPKTNEYMEYISY